MSADIINQDMLESAVRRGLDSYYRLELMLSKGKPIDLYAYTQKTQKFTSRLEDIVKAVSVKPDSLKFVFSDDEVEVVFTKGEYKVSAMINIENINCVHCFISKDKLIGGNYFEDEYNAPVVDWLNKALSIGED